MNLHCFLYDAVLMLCSENKVKEFLESIRISADSQAMQIEEEADKLILEESKKAEESAIKEAYLYLKKEISAKKAQIAKEYSMKEYDCRNAVFMRRKEIINEVFDRVIDQLISFTEKTEYKDMLLSCAKKISLSFADEKYIVYLRGRDEAFIDDLKGVLGKETSFQVADDIKLGGLRFFILNKKIIVDFTLDALLKDEKQSFTSINELRLS